MGKLSAKGKAALRTDIQAGNIDAFVRNYLAAGQKNDDELMANTRNELIRVLREYPDQIGVKNSDGNTLLHLAFLNNSPLLAKALLDLDLEYASKDNIDLLINIQNNAGQTPFAIAKVRNWQPSVDLIAPYTQSFCHACLTGGEIENFITTYKLVDSSTPGPLETIREQTLTFLRANPEKRYARDANGNTLLHLCILNDCPLLHQNLLEFDLEFIGEEQGLLINTKNKAGQTPLAKALVEKKPDSVKALVSYNASFYLERDSEGTYLSAQYALTDHLADLLPLGQALQPERLTKILAIVRTKAGAFSDPFLLREYLDRVAIRLIGLTGDGSDIDFKQWAKLYANSVSKVSDLCTIDSCFKFGEDFGESVNYLLIHVRALLELVVTRGNNPALEKELLIAVNTAKIDQETTLLNLLRQNNETMIYHHVNGLYIRLRTNSLLCYPGGWPGQTDVPGHAIYVDVVLTAPMVADEKTSATDPKKTPVSCQISVSNLGGGLEKDYNSGLMVTNKVALPATAVIKTNEKLIKGYFYRLVWANLNGTTEVKIDLALDGIYDKGIFGRPVRTLAKSDQAEVVQPIGNCIVKNFLFAMRNRSGDNLYRASYLQILNVIFEQIQSYCGKLPKPQDVVQALRASEVVFNNLTLIDIQYMEIFRKPSSICNTGKSKENKESDNNKKVKHRETPAEIIGKMGLLGFADKPSTYHRGQLLRYEQSASAHTSRRVIRMTRQ